MSGGKVGAGPHDTGSVTPMMFPAEVSGLLAFVNPIPLTLSDPCEAHVIET